MSGLGAGYKMDEYRAEIKQLRSQIASLGPVPDDMPEMIESANLLRKNEHLQKLDEAKSGLISNYEGYTASLESMLKSIFEIQDDLRDILREQSRLIPDKKRVRTTRTRRKRAKSP